MLRRADDDWRSHTALHCQPAWTPECLIERDCLTVVEATIICPPSQAPELQVPALCNAPITLYVPLKDQQLLRTRQDVVGWLQEEREPGDDPGDDEDGSCRENLRSRLRGGGKVSHACKRQL